MPIEDWEKDEGGNIRIGPLVDYETALVARMLLMMRIRFARPGDQLQNPSGAVQLGITAPQLALLIEDLQNRLGQMETRSPPRPQQN